MSKKLLAILICISSFGVSYGQVEISGGIYVDSTLSKPLSKVKLILKSDNYKKTFRTDKYGKFIIVAENLTDTFSLEIKKKGYMTIIIENISLDKNKSEIKYDVILRRLFSINNIEYEGPSELIIRN